MTEDVVTLRQFKKIDYGDIDPSLIVDVQKEIEDAYTRELTEIINNQMEALANNMLFETHMIIDVPEMNRQIDDMVNL